jgi:ABC-2 type transport system ATP-binding protein
VVVAGRGRVIADATVAELIGGSADPRSLEDAYLRLTREAVEFRGGPA